MLIIVVGRGGFDGLRTKVESVSKEMSFFEKKEMSS
jgi:hypothetical protein